MENKAKCFTIYSQRLAGYLMMNGFPLRFLVKGTERNQFLFDNTDKLRNAITAWQNKS